MNANKTGYELLMNLEELRQESLENELALSLAMNVLLTIGIVILFLAGGQ
jgi:hypothetical protein